MPHTSLPLKSHHSNRITTVILRRHHPPSLRSLRRQHWITWLQITTAFLWSLFPPILHPLPHRPSRKPHPRHPHPFCSIHANTKRSPTPCHHDMTFCHLYPTTQLKVVMQSQSKPSSKTFALKIHSNEHPPNLSRLHPPFSNNSNLASFIWLSNFLS